MVEVNISRVQLLVVKKFWSPLKVWSLFTSFFSLQLGSDEEATILFVKELHSPKVHPISYRDVEVLKTLFAGGSTRFSPNRVDNFEELLGKSSLLNIQKCIVSEAKRQENDNFKLSIDELKAFLGLCITCGVIKGRDGQL